MKMYQKFHRLSVLLVMLLLAMPTLLPSAFADELEDAEATIEALQTQVAEQEATIEVVEADKTPEPPTTSVPTAAVQPEQNPDGVSLEIGAQLATNVWSIEVLGVEQQSSIELYELFTAQGVYLLVTFQVANLTNIPLEFEYEELVVSDEAGRVYTYQDTITANLLNDRYDPLLEYSLLQPSLTYETVSVFEIPPESTSLRLMLSDGVDGRNDEAKAAATIASEHALPVGSSFLFGAWDIKVERTETVASISTVFGTHDARGEFLVVYIAATNTGLEPYSFPYPKLRLVDDSGRWFSYIHPPTDGMAYELTDRQTYEGFQPGIAYQTVIVFDIPADTSGLMLVASFDEPQLAVKI